MKTEVLSAALLGAGVLVGAAQAAELSCGFTQVTSSTGGGNFRPAISADSSRIAFFSSSNLTGGNADGNHEIFLYDVLSNSFTQVTSSTGGGNFRPSITADGSHIAFDSNRNLTGGNADGNAEIFLYDVASNSFTQVTSSTGGNSSTFPSISANGSRIAFTSTSHLTGGNGDFRGKIFLYDVGTDSLVRVTSATEGDSIESSVNADGSRIALISSSNPTGGNADGNDEIFLYEVLSNSFTQVTSSTEGFSGTPNISADGSRIAFNSISNLTGANADGDREIFLYDVGSNSLSQVTSATGGGFSFAPSLNADGTRIAFSSNTNPTGGNADGSGETFLYNTNTGALTQVTSSAGGGISVPSINADGNRIAIGSDRNLTGGNADGNDEILLADCAEAQAGALQLTSATYSANETDGSAILTVSRTGDSDGDVSVDYTTVASTEPGAATEGADYTFTQGTLTWTDGDTADKTLPVPVLDDGDFEGDETLNVTLSNPMSGAVLGTPATATLTIVDDEMAQPGTLSFSAGNYTVNEPDGASIITVNRSGGSNGQVSIDYATNTGGTATPGSDYTDVNGTLTWTDGDTTDKTFSVPIIDDAILEGDETASLTLGNGTPGTNIGTSAAVLTIVDNDQPGSITCNGLTATIVGTEGRDRIQGTSGADVIAALGGDDRITGASGNDTICGGTGNDQLRGGPGNDVMLGEDGNDRVLGGGGNDAMDGGEDTDSCDGGGGRGDTVISRCETVLGVP